MSIPLDSVEIPHFCDQLPGVINSTPFLRGVLQLAGGGGGGQLFFFFLIIIS